MLKITVDQEKDVIIFDNGIKVSSQRLSMTTFSTDKFHRGVNRLVATFYNCGLVTTSSLVTDIELDGEVLTESDAHKKLQDVLFIEGNGSSVSLPIEIADVAGLNEELGNKATLVDGTVPASQLPSYVDDIIEGELVNDAEFDVDGFIVQGERGKIYVDTTTNKSYRWATNYIEISKTPTKETLGLGNVDNTSDINKPVSTAQKKAITDAVSDIQIGGVNLLNGTAEFTIGDIAPNYSGWGADSGRFRGNVIKKINTVWNGFRLLNFVDNKLPYECVLSFCARVDSGVTYFNSTSQLGFSIKVDSTTWKQYSVVLPVGTIVNNDKRQGILEATSGNTVYISSIKLERGNKATDWSLSPVDVQKEINDIQIGGVNLLDNSKNIFGSSNVVEDYQGFKVRSITRVSGDSQKDLCEIKTPILNSLAYTVSFYVKADRNNTLFNNFFFDPNNTVKAVTSDGNSSLAVDGRIQLTASTEWKRCWITWTQSSAGVAKNIYLGRLQNEFYCTLSICGIKFEEGNKASTWSPSPKDVDRKIDNIQVGGRNLLRNTGCFKNTDYWNINKGTGETGTVELVNDSIYGNVIHTGRSSISSWWLLYNRWIAYFPERFEVGKEYTVSFLVKSLNAKPIAVSFRDSNGTNLVVTQSVNTTKDWQRVYVTFIPLVSGGAPEFQITITNIDEIWITQIQLEQGNKATTWSPAPEDIESNSVQKVKDLYKYTATSISSNITLSLDKTYNHLITASSTGCTVTLPLSAKHEGVTCKIYNQGSNSFNVIHSSQTVAIAPKSIATFECVPSGSGYIWLHLT